MIGSEIGNSSKEYKRRYKAYGDKYISGWPEPEQIDSQSGGANLGAQKSALNRQTRYNDRTTTQTTKVKGIK